MQWRFSQQRRYWILQCTCLKLATCKQTESKDYSLLHILHLLLNSILCLDGGFELDQTSPGQLTDFNMWQHEMTLDELNSATCGTKGDVVSWDTLQERGSSSKTNKFLPGCNGKHTSLNLFFVTLLAKWKPTKSSLRLKMYFKVTQKLQANKIDFFKICRPVFVAYYFPPFNKNFMA